MKSWEKTGKLEREIIPQLESHLITCVICKKRYTALLPFIFRDGDDEQGLGFSFKASVEQLKKMGKIIAQTKEKTRIWPWLGIAATLIIGVGILFFALYPVLLFGVDENTSLVEFKLAAPEAESVVLVGDFTEWEKKKVIMSNSKKDGMWKVEIRLEKGKLYKYKFIIDGKLWISDPNALLQVEDGFGGENSLLQL